MKQRTRKRLLVLFGSSTVLLLGAWIALRIARPMLYVAGDETVRAGAFEDPSLLLWRAPVVQASLPGAIRGRVARLPDGRLVYGRARGRHATELVTFDPKRPSAGEEPLFLARAQGHDLAPALDRRGRLWFASDRPGSRGGFDLWFSEPRGTRFARPQRWEHEANTALDETDPCPDPTSDDVVFVRRDPELREGRNGLLLIARDGGEVTACLDALSRPRSEEIPFDRDPAFDASGEMLWFVRQERGTARVLRSRRLRGQFGEERPWGGEGSRRDLRSPLPSADGLVVSFVAPGREPPLLLRSDAFEAPVWAPAFDDLEQQLLIALLLCALLVLLLFLGDRWRKLDIITQCLLFSLLLHLLLLLLFGGAQLVRSFDVPGPGQERMHLRVRAPTAPRSAESSTGRSSVVTAARMQRSTAELALDAPTHSAAEPAGARRAGASERQADVRELASATTSMRDRAPEATRRSSGDAAARKSTAAALAPLRSQRAQLAVAEAPEAGERSPLAIQAPKAVVGGARNAAHRGREGLRAVAAPRHLAAAPAARLRESATERVSRRQGEDGVAATLRPEAMHAAPRSDPGSSSISPVRPAGEGSAALELSRPGSAVAASGRRRPAATAESSTERAADLPEPEHVALRDRSAEEARRSAAAHEDESRGHEPRAFAELGAEAPRSGAMNRPVRASAAPGTGLELEAPGSALGLSRRASGSSEGLSRARSVAVAAAALREAPESEGGSERRGVAEDSSPRVAALARARGLPELRPSSAPVFRAPGLALSHTRRGLWSPPLSRLDRAERTAAAGTAPAGPEMYANRFGAKKAAALERYGGTRATEAAVRKGLDYLARIQQRDGSWGRRQGRSSKYGDTRVGRSGLCVLAFLGGGHYPGSGTEHEAVVRRGVDWLLAQQRPSAHFGRCSAYGHGIATYAIAECSAMTREKKLRARLLPALRDACLWILENQDQGRDPRSHGGWPYYSDALRPEDGFARVSVSAWQLMALESAKLSGFEIDPEVFGDARKYLSRSFDGRRGYYLYNQKPSRLRSRWRTLPASTPAAIFCLLLTGTQPGDGDVQRGLRYVLARKPQSYRRYSDDQFVRQGQGNVYFWYYGSLACFLAGGEAWKDWNEQLKRVLPSAQSRDGSFAPIDVYAEYAGDSDRDRAYTTAMCVLSLEVYYRYFTPLLRGR